MGEVSQLGTGKTRCQDSLPSHVRAVGSAPHVPPPNSHSSPKGIGSVSFLSFSALPLPHLWARDPSFAVSSKWGWEWGVRRVSRKGKASRETRMEQERKGQQNYISETETKADTGEFSAMAMAIIATRSDSS